MSTELNTVTGQIISFKRFEIHDGDGIRTTLFLKGCPLACKWCHNPESFSQKPILAFYESVCTSCGRCVNACENGCHWFDNTGKHYFDRTNCTGCGRCAAACPASALVCYGETASAEEVLKKLCQDKPFYDASGGGVTISGGEPLLQPDFCRALLCALKQQGISTAIDTCGFAARSAIDAVLPYTDTFLYDIKAMDEAVHIRATGQSNQMILDNLRYIDAAGKRIEVRIPYVPGFNDREIPAIAEFLKTLSSLACVKVLGYHNYAEDKYRAIGMEDRFKTIPCPSDTEIHKAKEILRQALPEIKIE